MFNHIEAVQLFVKSGESLDQVINTNADKLPGYTLLHCAIRYSSTEAAVILITFGADIYIENAWGTSSLCYLIERLLDANDYLKMSTDSYSSPYEKEIERLDSIMKAIVLKYRTNDSILVENTGLSAFHLACLLKDNWITQSYITWDFKDINKPVTSKSKVWSGWTALHFAVCGDIQTFRILLGNGANIKIKNAKGETALDLCFQRYNPERALLYLPRNIIMSDKSTKLLHLIKAISTQDSCQEFLQKLTDINISVAPESPFWPGYNLLHMSVSMNHKMKFPEVFRNKTDYDAKTGYCVNLPRNEGTRPMYWSRFEMILKKGCSIYAKNADGLTPIHLAFKLHEWHAAEELLIRAQYNVVGPGNLSFLHIACAMGKNDVVQRLLNRGASVNSPVTSTFEWHEKPESSAEICDLRKVSIRRNSTPLHIAVIFNMEKTVEVLVKKYPDVHAKDELGYTPIHLAFTSTKKIAQLLFSRVSNLRDIKRHDSLSHLHVAAFADNEKAIKKLVQNGANVKQTYGGQTPLHLAMSGEKAAQVLVEMGADVCVENEQNETALDLAMKHLYSRSSKFLFQKLKNNELTINASTTSGLTALHVACAILDVDWTKNLLINGVDPNAQMSDSDGRTNTPMHLAVANTVSAHPVERKLAIIIKLLLEHGADIAIDNNWGTTPLHMMANSYLEPFVIHQDWLENDRVFLLTTIGFMLLSQKSFKINPANTNGFSHFHIACVSNNLGVVKKYMDNGVDVNLSTCPFSKENARFTPLHFAIKLKNSETIQLLLQREANVKTVDTNGNTPLHTAVQSNFFNLQFVDTMLKKGADINAKNLKGETPIMILLLRYINISHEQIFFFLSRGSLIDITKEFCEGQGIIGYAIGKTKPSDIELVFETLIEFGDVKNAISKGFLAIHDIVFVQRCKNLTREHYLSAIQRLIDLGSDVDEQNEQGRTALDKAVHFGNVGAIEALLLLGANINFIKTYCCWSINDTLPGQTSTVLNNHLWKMTMVKLDTNASIRWKDKEPYDTAAKVFRLELEKTKNTRIFHSLTAKHFLSEWGAVIDYPTMSIGERQAVDNFFNQTDQLREEFPEFAGLLMMQYRKAFARVKLMQPVKNILVEAGIDLPDLCLEAILKYFKNSELSFLIENADEVPPCKRQRIE